jgi:HAD superfamily phosphoserine phosphatase-like hydrolase
MDKRTLKNNLKLAVFDVEGVLLPKNRYLTFEIGRNLSITKFIKYLCVAFLYEARLISLESALKTVFKLFRGISTNELLRIFQQVPLLPFAESVLGKLRKKGLKIVLISSGLPQIIVNNLASRLNADYAFGLDLEIDNGVLTGGIKGKVITKNGKSYILEKLLKRENLEPKNCVVIADDRNNSSIFYPEALKIGCNPDAAIILKSDYVIKDNLMEIVPIIEQKPKTPPSFISRNEAIREIIHASGFLVALAARHLGAFLTITLLFFTVLVYIVSELARVEKKNMPVISSITLNAATDYERFEFALTPVFLALGIILSLLFFSTPINFAVIAVISLGDSAASIFGRLFGKNSIPYNKGKNIEGSLAGFVFAFLGASYFMNPFPALVAAATGMFVETLPLPVNDNLSIPLITGIVLTVLELICMDFIL